MGKPGPEKQDWDPRLWQVMKLHKKGMGIKPACKVLDPENWASLHREYYRRNKAKTLPTKPPVSRATRDAATEARLYHERYHRKHRLIIEETRRRLSELGYDPDEPRITALEATLMAELEKLRGQLGGDDPFGGDESRPSEEEEDEALAAKAARLDELEEVVPALQAMIDSMRHMGLLE